MQKVGGHASRMKMVDFQPGWLKMLMLKFSEDIVDISISAHSLADSLTFMLSQHVLIGH